MTSGEKMRRRRKFERRGILWTLYMDAFCRRHGYTTWFQTGEHARAGVFTVRRTFEVLG